MNEKLIVIVACLIPLVAPITAFIIYSVLKGDDSQDEYKHSTYH